MPPPPHRPTSNATSCAWHIPQNIFKSQDVPSMLSDKLSSPPTPLRSPLHGGVKSRARTPCLVASDKRLQCSEQLRSTPVDRKRQRSSSGTASRQRKHEFIHPLWNKVFWRGNNAVKIIRRQGVSVCVLVGVSLCVPFTDTAALCACVLAPTLRQKKNSEISLTRPTFESNFGEPAPASTTSHLVPEKRTLTQKLVVRRDRRDSVLCIFITRAIRKLPFHATHKREKKGREHRKKETHYHPHDVF